MDMDIMARAIREIQELQQALDWLREHRDRLTDADTGCRSIFLRPAYASACPGYKQATDQLNAVAHLHLDAIVEHAIKDAENTIALRQQQIVDQANDLEEHVGLRRPPG